MRVADLVGDAVLRPADASVRRSALAVGVSFAVNGALVATWISRLPAMKHDVGADPSGLGLALLCLAAGSMAAMTLCPRLVRRWGSRAVCRVVMVWTSVSVPLLALAPNVAGLALAFAIVGAGWGVWDVTMNVQGHRVEQLSGRAFMPRFHAAWSGGALAGAGVGALCAHAQVSPDWQFRVVAAVVLCASLTASLAFVEDEPSRERPERASRSFNHWLLLIGILTMCSTLGEGAASDWLAIFLVDERQHSQAVGAAGFTVYALAMVVGRSAGTNIVERVGRVTALRTAGLLTAVGVALTLTVPADPATVVGIALWGLGLALVFPTAMSAAAERGETPAGGIAAVATLGYTGFLVGPPTIGFLAASFSLERALWVVALLGVATSVLASFVRPPSGDVRR
jgi:MFS family permease